MEMDKKIIKFIRAKKGTPCIWESYKRFSSMKRVTVIFDDNGDRVEPIFNRIGSSDSLVPIRNGYFILKVFFDRDGISISILRILNIDPYSNKAEVEMVSRKPNDSDAWHKNTNLENSNINNEMFLKIKGISDDIIDENKN